MKKKFEINAVMKDSVYSFFYRILSMFLNYLYIAIIVRKLGSAKYGVWAVLLSVISWIEILDLGIGNGLRNFLAKIINTEREREAKLAISTAYCILSVIGIILLLITCTVSLFVPWNCILGYEDSEENLTEIILLFFLFIILNFILSLCKSVLHALQKTRITYLMGAWLNAFNIAAILYMSRCSLLKLVISYGLNLNLVSLLVSIYIYWIKDKQLKPQLGLYSSRYIPHIVNQGFYFFIIQISSCVISWTDSLLTARYFGSEAVTPFSLINKVFILPISLCLCVFAPLWSAFTKASVTNDKNWMQMIVYRFNKSFLFILAGLLVLGIGTPFIVEIWTGVYVGDERELIVSTIVFAALRIWCAFYAQLANGLDIMKSYLLLSILQGFVNIPLSIMLAVNAQMGITGIVAGTNIVLLAGAIYLPQIVRRKVGG